MGITAEQLKEMLGSPLALFGLMFFASFVSALKQMIIAKRNGTPMSFSSYFLGHWVETVVMLGTNVIAFTTLIMTDSLNFAAAIGIGYLANDAADTFTKQGRSSSLNGG